MALALSATATRGPATPADAAAPPPAARLLGSAVNQDGRSSSLTAPHGPSQQGVIAAALGAARLGPDRMAGLELHGTGTPLGDPIELHAAGKVLCPSTRGPVPRVPPLHAHAAKTAAGHAEPAAGGVGMLAAVLRRVGFCGSFHVHAGFVLVGLRPYSLMHACMHACLSVHACCTHISMHMSMHICMHVSMHMRMDAWAWGQAYEALRVLLHTGRHCPASSTGCSMGWRLSCLA